MKTWKILNLLCTVCNRICGTHHKLRLFLLYRFAGYYWSYWHKCMLLGIFPRVMHDLFSGIHTMVCMHLSCSLPIDCNLNAFLALEQIEYLHMYSLYSWLDVTMQGCSITWVMGPSIFVVSPVWWKSSLKLIVWRNCCCSFVWSVNKYGRHHESFFTVIAFNFGYGPKSPRYIWNNNFVGRHALSDHDH